jgi:MFS family permease
MRSKIALQISCLTYTIWVISGYFATLPETDYRIVLSATLFGSFMIGLGAAVLWVAQGKYLSDCIQKASQHSGLYTGTFFTIQSGSMIFAFMFNTIILGSYEPNTLFLIDTIISIVPVIVYALLPDPKMPETKMPTESQ